MMRAAFWLELRRSRQLALWLGVVIVFYAGFCAVVYPYLRDSTAQLDEYLKVYPKDVLAAFGMEGSIADPGVFWNTYIGAMLWPIVAAIVAAILASRISADTDSGWIEQTVAAPMTRARYALVTVAVQAVVLAALAVVTLAAVLIVGAIVGARFDAPRFALATVAAWLFGAAFSAFATLVSVVTLRRGVAAGAAAGTMLVMYVFNIVALLQPDLRWLQNLSAFRWLYPKQVVDDFALSLPEVGLYVAIIVSCWTAGVLLFRRRDLLT